MVLVTADGFSVYSKLASGLRIFRGVFSLYTPDIIFIYRSVSYFGALCGLSSFSLSLFRTFVDIHGRSSSLQHTNTLHILQQIQ